ncbi:MAG TPA: UDP-N-acetylmuramoyl-L-alanine--D-glutamate ligase [Chloroflexota bacterium]|nr:UDP-N-acetylmuramoyl-L-alanine--D-glutamate ligase [Chloroflexota bacterium]
MSRYPIDDFQNRQVTLIGLGTRTHVHLARYLVRHGARVRISERKPREQLDAEMELIRDLPVELRLGGHHDDDVIDSDMVFVSPGVPRDLPILSVARARGIPISSEIELLLARCPAPIVGITGSAGKTTTTSLVGEMLRADGTFVLVGGNIGIPLIDRVDEISAASRVVLELSSYQLEALRQSPPIGTVLNVTPNHLDRHPSFEHYRECKFNLLRYQTANDVAVLSADDPVAASFAPRAVGSVRLFSGAGEVQEGAFARGDELIVRDHGVEEPFARIPKLRLPGRHNVLNVLAAAAVARVVGIAPDAIGRVATTFAGVEHRLEFVRELAGVSYYDDSIATTPERAMAALRSFSRPIVLIAGGRSKHLAMEEFAREIAHRARAVVTVGEMADEVEGAIRACPSGGDVAIERAPSFEGAVRAARDLARPGDVVLLSPSGTSYDQFRDFEERGRRFKSAVWALDGGNA